MIRNFCLIAATLATTLVLAADALPYAGKWKAKEGSSGPAKMIEFIQDGDNALTIKIADHSAVCNAKFDGADYPATGDGVPPGYTLAIKKTGSRSFQMVQKRDGKRISTTNFSVSDDGNTLTEADHESTGSDLVKVVYERVAN
jgi:hypothetical protein